ncbi:MAG TPA: superoxide dismutase [Campylobacterales bacterium]|nr:superoxide dismutase [Campylobacterales bacterium]
MKTTIKKSILALALVTTAIIIPQQLTAHCQVPCGIYDDNARVKAMLEDVSTVAKSVKLINELAGKTDAQSQNQMARWVMNKEKHAQNIIATISDYFLTQRVKSSAKDYTERLVKHHTVIVAAMKAKQNADDKSVEALHKAVDALEAYYPAPKAAH